MRDRAAVSAFPFIDLRVLFFLVVHAFPVCFYLARQRGIPIPALAWPLAGVAGVFLVAAMRAARKNALVISGDSIAIRPSMFRGAVTIPFSAMESVVLTNGRAVFMYADDAGKLKRTALPFGIIRFALKNEARRALRESLEAHGVRIG
ncbi:hypothetical protein LJC26_08625 [Desulfovibrio sp. OttesenSCG-928-O18]|nr:hypothetical protein [Desulfovibrio sp. OttesenSCG-928-O18]